MKAGWLLLLLALTVLTDLAWRPLWSLGTATVDPPLLLVMWLALNRWRGRVHFVLVVLAVLRWQLGLAGLADSYLPPALAAELLLLASPFLHLRRFPRGVPAIALAIPLVVGLELTLIGGQQLLGVARDAAFAGVVAALFAVMLIPILDAIEPLLEPRRW